MNSMVNAAGVQTSMPVGSIVAAIRGDFAGVAGTVIATGWNAGGKTVTVQYQLSGKTITKDFFAEVVELLELPEHFVRKSRCGRFTLVRDVDYIDNRPGHIRIDHDDYGIVIVPNASPEVLACFRLVKLFDKKADPEGHVVTALRSHEDCTCPHFIYRAGPDGKRCKHLQAVYELGLVPVTTDYEIVIPEGMTEFDIPY
jgi:hypothetical protein